MDDNLIRRELLVDNPEGLHARPAALIVKLANQFESRIDLLKGGQRVNAKSIMDLLTLAAEQGEVLVLEAGGDDAQAAADAIERFFVDGFGDAQTEPNTPQP